MIVVAVKNVIKLIKSNYSPKIVFNVISSPTNKFLSRCQLFYSQIILMRVRAGSTQWVDPV